MFNDEVVTFWEATASPHEWHPGTDYRNVESSIAHHG
jgi:hypothetical protein